MYMQHIPLQRPSSLPARTHKDDHFSQCPRQINTSADSYAKAEEIRSQQDIGKYEGCPPYARPSTARLTSKDAPARLRWGWRRACTLQATRDWGYRWPKRALGRGNSLYGILHAVLPALSRPEGSHGTRCSVPGAGSSGSAAAPWVRTPLANSPLSHPVKALLPFPPSPPLPEAQDPPTQSLARTSAARRQDRPRRGRELLESRRPSVPAAPVRGQSHVPRRRARLPQSRPPRCSAAAPWGTLGRGFREGSREGRAREETGTQRCGAGAGEESGVGAGPFGGGV